MTCWGLQASEGLHVPTAAAYEWRLLRCGAGASTAFTSLATSCLLLGGHAPNSHALIPQLEWWQEHAPLFAPLAPAVPKTCRITSSGIIAAETERDGRIHCVVLWGW